MPTILDLLMALNRGDLPPLPGPAPSAPIPYAPTNLGPLSDETTAAFAAQNPEPVPPRFIQPAAPDANFVNQYSGAAPTPPAPPSRAQRIMNAIAGFGAGVQGQGAQFLSQLQEPQREYQRQVERYEGRRAQGLEAAERRAEREAAQANRAAELQYDRDFKAWMKKNDVRDDAAATQAKYAFDLLRDAKRFDAERQEQDRRERAAKAKQRNDIYAKLISQDFAPTRHAEEIADNIVFGKPLSAAAEKWRSVKARKLEAQLANIGGGGGTGPVMARLQDGQLVPASLVNREFGGVILNGQLIPVVEYVGGKIPARPQSQATTPAKSLTDQFINPGYIESLLAPTAQKQAEPTDDEVKAYARRFKMSPKKARAELMGQ